MKEGGNSYESSKQVLKDAIFQEGNQNNIEHDGETAGSRIVNASFEACKKQIIDQALREEAKRKKSKGYVPSAFSKWKAWASGLLLAFSLNAISPDARATTESSTVNERDELDQMDDYVERIVREAKERLAIYDLTLLKIAVQLKDELIKEAPPKNISSASENPFSPVSKKKFKDKQEMIKNYDEGALSDKANIMARKIIFDNLGDEVLGDEEIQKIVKSLVEAYSKRSVKDIEVIYDSIYVRAIKELLNSERDKNDEINQPKGESINLKRDQINLTIPEYKSMDDDDDQSSLLNDLKFKLNFDPDKVLNIENTPPAPAELEGPPSPRKIDLPENYNFIDLVNGIKIYRKAMLNNIVEVGESYKKLLENNNSQILNEIAGSEKDKIKFANKYLSGLNAEQKFLILLNKEICNDLQEKLLAKKVDISHADWIQKFENLINIFSYKKAEGHTETFIDEIKPNMHNELFRKMGQALIMGDKQKLEDIVNRAKLQIIQMELTDYNNASEFDKDFKEGEVEGRSHDDTYRKLRKVDINEGASGSSSASKKVRKMFRAFHP